GRGRPCRSRARRSPWCAGAPSSRRAMVRDSIAASPAPPSCCFCTARCSRPGSRQADVRIVAIAARTVRWPIVARGAARGRSERAAVLLEARSNGGTVGLGEAAPLPGMSLDTLDDAEAAIAALARCVPFEVTDRAIAIADPDAARMLATAPAAARFAIESALLDARAREL